METDNGKLTILFEETCTNKESVMRLLRQAMGLRNDIKCFEDLVADDEAQVGADTSAGRCYNGARVYATAAIKAIDEALDALNKALYRLPMPITEC